MSTDEFRVFRPDCDRETHFVVRYFLGCATNLREAAWNLAIGQSVGNPNVRNQWETAELFENSSCKVLGDPDALSLLKEGEVDIAFPIANTDWKEDGVTHLFVQVMGGQLDIDLIKQCHVLKIDFPKAVLDTFPKPKYGIPGIRKYVGVESKPLLGAIVKPKIGITSDVLVEMVKELAEGGVNFIKEDEIMANPAICPIEERVPKVMKYLNSLDRKIVYAVCINADSPYVLERVKRVHALGGNGVHVNFWAGLGIYKAIRELDLPIFLHFQKSGDKILTNKSHAFHIRWNVICDLAGLSGADFIHAGMWGGYSNTEAEDLKQDMETLHKHGTMPALSCGMQPGLVQAINKRMGMQYMANTGGAIHGHPGGTMAGAKAMKQAIDGDHGPEYEAAIAKWGLVN
mmetsp:Transcript_34096/g.47255  ORF Transcript_34096/g.47255 Transcript_34096/m.47255 type:complete len:401 (+) Transcript_34096:134-1336(+)|eukprot:CAMPEP_0196578904 /NCGR_PEP_ID=MMETSP1081-20130531/12263_1 /TAXON_ID=36882 /ORGANISM="Pyramimonas amylifera, Strain CCMP720" /LENGTH=400 /DNA_ID=CAMNT_0041898293 /DNA_START=129 /DNA_END=1331 /DNA_ORIENTATION=+